MIEFDNFKITATIPFNYEMMEGESSKFSSFDYFDYASTLRIFLRNQSLITVYD